MLEVGGEKQKGEEVEKGREKKEKSRGGGEEEMEKRKDSRGVKRQNGNESLPNKTYLPKGLTQNNHGIQYSLVQIKKSAIATRCQGRRRRRDGERKRGERGGEGDRRGEEGERRRGGKGERPRGREGERLPGCAAPLATFFLTIKPGVPRQERGGEERRNWREESGGGGFT